MKGGSIAIWLLLILFACTDSAIGPNQIIPLREIHFDLTTGEKIGEKNFEFNEKSLLVRETFTDPKHPGSGRETLNEYDEKGNLVKVKSKPFSAGHSNIIEYTYINDRKMTEVVSYDGAPGYERTEFYYNGSNLADSSRLIISDDGWQVQYWRKSIYTYDNAGHMTVNVNTDVAGVDQRIDFTYDADNLVSTCYRYPAFDGECILNEYDRNGHLTKVTSVRGSVRRLTEERFYSVGVLVEKRLYFDGSSWGDPGLGISGTRIIYEY